MPEGITSYNHSLPSSGVKTTSFFIGNWGVLSSLGTAYLNGRARELGSNLFVNTRVDS